MTSLGQRDETVTLLSAHGYYDPIAKTEEVEVDKFQEKRFEIDSGPKHFSWRGGIRWCTYCGYVGG